VCVAKPPVPGPLQLPKWRAQASVAASVDYERLHCFWLTSAWSFKFWAKICACQPTDFQSDQGFFFVFFFFFRHRTKVIVAHPLGAGCPLPSPEVISWCLWLLYPLRWRVYTEPCQIARTEGVILGQRNIDVKEGSGSWSASLLRGRDDVVFYRSLSRWSLQFVATKDVRFSNFENFTFQTELGRVILFFKAAQVAIFNGVTKLFTSMNLDEPCWR
jgi:hypothetical protein